MQDAALKALARVIENSPQIIPLIVYSVRMEGNTPTATQTSETMNHQTKSTERTATHTPGPWKANGCQITAQGDMRLIVAIALSASDVLANRYSGHAAKTQADGIANARLIAAAPELLAQLKALSDAVARYEGANTADDIDSAESGMLHEAKIARAAIVKAEGSK